ncbi:hypothetical protein [Bradyrhizobium sp. USDA 10063]
MRALRERERELAGRLKDAGESQVIGGRVFQTIKPAAINRVLGCDGGLGNIASTSGRTNNFAGGSTSVAEERGRGD